MTTVNLELQTLISSDTIPQKKDFKRWVTLANERDEAIDICIRVVDDPEMRQLNHAYRQKDKLTNVLSFAYALENNFDAQEIPLHLGDIVLCHSVISQEALEQGKNIFDHYAHLTIHGMLHLLGYDHINTNDAMKMENREVALLAQLNIQNPYQLDANHDTH